MKLLLIAVVTVALGCHTAFDMRLKCRWDGDRCVSPTGQIIGQVYSNSDGTWTAIAFGVCGTDRSPFVSREAARACVETARDVRP